ncbi:uncharacterized protein PITG_19631 [Phytophthora infestans T30-4]|uniref:Uncharacterized protein n=1 Tax=Phytophthora infestans (strain T30-4) TaxID=403677 RepID=D0P0G5_PHYIT|nr:uncharacterized protein PITG_19631 [Phytophthora infestans T30-4]EEY52927.1 hypothetical protein PITG_19631 [Phytophthora infestans T30-4]|eukprot:XP_002896194.1 hypothetical protein PITG_19631 [Phytophthora infestans T30-4]
MRRPAAKQRPNATSQGTRRVYPHSEHVSDGESASDAASVDGSVAQLLHGGYDACLDVVEVLCAVLDVVGSPRALETM